MKTSKRVMGLLLVGSMGIISLVGCGKKNEPVADLNNWVNAIYITDTYSEDMKVTFTEAEFNECKKAVTDEIEKEFVGKEMEELKTQISSLAKEGSDKEIDTLMNKLKDGVIAPMFTSFKDIKFTVEEVSKDGEKATLKVKSAPIDLNGTTEKMMTLFAEKTPKDFDPASITPENAVESFDKLFVTPMCDAYAETFAAPVYLPEKEVIINMEYNKETKAWEPADLDMENLEAIFIV